MRKGSILLAFLLCISAVIGLPAGQTPASAESGLTGTALNLLFFIELGGSGEEGFFAEAPQGSEQTRRAQTLSLFNEEELGVKDYFRQISGSAFTLHTLEVPGVYVDEHTHGYYLPYAADNPEGFWQYMDGEIRVYDCGCEGTCGAGCDLDASDGMVCLCGASHPDGLTESLEKLRREQLLIHRAASELLGSAQGLALLEGLAGLDLDGDLQPDVGDRPLDLNGDGVTDLLTFYVSGGEPDSGNTATFWPHKWELIQSAAVLQAQSPREFASWSEADRETLCQSLTAGQTSVKNYILLADGYVRGSARTFEAGVLCHETIHMLDTLAPGGERFGVTDLYHYDPQPGAEIPVGVWDIMGVTSAWPQGLNACYREKFGWLRLETAEPETLRYRLSTDGTFPAAIRFGGEEGQYFVIEAKTRTEDGLDRQLPFLSPGETGLLCYRVNPGAAGALGGNIDGQNEIYVLRKTGAGQILYPYLFDGVFTEGESFGSPEAAVTENVFGYETDEGIRNSRAVLSNIRLEEDGSVSFDLRLNPEQFRTSGELVFDQFPAEGVQIYRNGQPAGRATEPTFTLEVQEGDQLTFFARGYELPILTVGKQQTELGQIQARAKATVGVEIALVNEEGQPFTDEIPGLLLNGQPYSDFNFREGVITARLYDTDVLTVTLEDFTLEDLGEGPGTVRVSGDRVTLRVYGYLTVSGQVLGEDGQPVGESFVLFADGLQVGQTDEQGRFSLDRVAYGTVLTFQGRAHSVQSYTVSESVSDLQLTAVQNPGAIRVPGWTLIVVGAVFLIAVYYYVVVDTRKKYKDVRRRR